MPDQRSEPSMEEILASIKRIIADDNPLPRRAYSAPPPQAERPLAPSVERPLPPSAPPESPAVVAWTPPPPVFPVQPPSPFARLPEPPQHDDSILELTNLVPDLSPPPRLPIDQPISWASSDVAAPPAPSREEAPAVRRVVERLRQSEAASSHARAASVTATDPFTESPPAVVAQPAPLPTATAPSPGGGVTLEAMVRDMLRPMLSDWIDTHLPAIVERLVKQEMSGIADEQG